MNCFSNLYKQYYHLQDCCKSLPADNGSTNLLQYGITKEYFSETMYEPVCEIIKYLSKSKSARLRLENPPLYKPKKEKKKGMMASMLGM